MIFINIKKLEAKVIQIELSIKEVVDYLIASSILAAILGFIRSLSGLKTGYVIIPIIAAVIYIIGIKISFQINESNDGKDFFKRFIAIYWVNMIRVTLWYLLFGFIYVQVFSFTKDPRLTSLAYITLNIIINLMLLRFNINSFKRLKQKTLAQNSINIQ